MPGTKNPADNSGPAPADQPADAPAETGADAPDAEAEAAPLNRAERRARGKGKTQTQPSFRGKVVGGHGPAHTQRMWSNRRSGG